MLAVCAASSATCAAVRSLLGPSQALRAVRGKGHKRRLAQLLIAREDVHERVGRANHFRPPKMIVQWNENESRFELAQRRNYAKAAEG